uniref:RING-type E3 ubiquitin transferase n=2 Tax=Triticum urartu TaxID=4572 RepID=A0A8R7TBH5_TRIUA
MLLLLLVCWTQAQPAAEETPPGAGVKVSFRPSVAIVVGIFTMIFSLTFLLLMYAKFCHPANTPLLPATTTASPSRAPAPDALIESEASAGVGKAVIESLPFFRFAALRGARQGLECAVCLARFDDADLLRLLPRCRHAFHLDCVDRWLHSSASCPLCRARVHPDDADLGLKYAAASARFVFGAGDDAAAVAAGPAPSSGRDLLAGIFVERVPSARFGGDDADGDAADDSNTKLDRHRHRIVVSDSVFKSRWSDLNSADLIALDTEMLRSVSSGRFPYPYPYPDDDIIFVGEEQEHDRDDHDGARMSVEIQKKRLLEVESGSGSKGLGLGGCGGSEAVEPSVRAASRLVSSGVRSMSEIVRLPRVAVRATEEEERARQRWVPIARRTARWFAARSREEDVNAADRLRV